MLRVFSHVKSSHGIYESLRDAGRDIQHNVLIIGLDSSLGAAYTVKEVAQKHDRSIEDLLKIPFFLYLEDMSTLLGSQGEAPWRSGFSGPVLEIESIIKHPNFLGAISHIKDTCVRVFTSLGIRCYHLPTSSTDKDSARISNRIASLSSDRPITLVHWGSYKDFKDANAVNRGLELVDRFVHSLFSNRVNCKLLLKSGNPARNLHCLEVYPERVALVTEYLGDEELQELFYTGDIYLLPSRQVHSTSLTDAFSYGMPVIGSTGWGMSEYCFNALNSLTDEVGDPSRRLSERMSIDTMYLEKMIPRITALINSRDLLARMSENTLAWYNSNHSRENHKANLHKIVDLAMSRHIK